MRFKCDMQPQISTQEMHELPQTEREIERKREIGRERERKIYRYWITREFKQSKQSVDQIYFY